ncbi:hypothetical protein SRABI106_00415 [Rahnella aquatilis]|nr:hypothetical protein SRABI106_00415 [Rahnella aquatilis]
MNLYDMLRFDEGLKLELYKDTEGYWTIGVGSLITKLQSKIEAIKIMDKILSRSTNGKITPQESEILFNKGIQNALRGIQSTTLSETHKMMDEPRRMALMNMVYQLGIAGVLGFRKMINHLNAGNYRAASLEALNSKWARQTPNRARRVTAVMSTGTFNSYPA